MDLREIMNIDPEVLSGEPVFKGTHVPIVMIYAYMQGGAYLDEFLMDYPEVTREQAVAAIELCKQLLSTPDDN